MTSSVDGLSSWRHTNEASNNDEQQMTDNNNHHRKHIDNITNADSQYSEASALIMKPTPMGCHNNDAVQSNGNKKQHYYATKISMDNGSFSEERGEGCLHLSSIRATVAPVLTCLKTLWNRYNELLDKRPVVVKMITATIILGCSDLLAQWIEHIMITTTDTSSENITEDFTIDWPRAIRFGLIGLIGAPWSHYYFTLLDHCFPPTIHPCTWITFIKVCIDQFIQSPIMLIGMISFLCILEGRGWNGIKHDMKTSFVPSMIANWKLWIPASFVNLGFVKPSLRVLYVNVVFFVWIVILSLLLNSKTATTN